MQKPSKYIQGKLNEAKQIENEFEIAYKENPDHFPKGFKESFAKLFDLICWIPEEVLDGQNMLNYLRDYLLDNQEVDFFMKHFDQTENDDFGNIKFLYSWKRVKNMTKVKRTQLLAPSLRSYDRLMEDELRYAMEINPNNLEGLGDSKFPMTLAEFNVRKRHDKFLIEQRRRKMEAIMKFKIEREKRLAAEELKLKQQQQADFEYYHRINNVDEYNKNGPQRIVNQDILARIKSKQN
jgi:hypothetical protein